MRTKLKSIIFESCGRGGVVLKIVLMFHLVIRGSRCEAIVDRYVRSLHRGRLRFAPVFLRRALVEPCSAISMNVFPG